MSGYTLRFDTTNDAPLMPRAWQPYVLIACPSCGALRPLPAAYHGSNSTELQRPGYVCGCGWWAQP